ncbi:hypothetical protein CBM2606_A150097 [Cupriavidus taiwanensis]|nr:hypothetical protein CBM2606_A150097 [Cupriavidus taiwanensis]
MLSACLSKNISYLGTQRLNFVVMPVMPFTLRRTDFTGTK